MTKEYLFFEMDLLITKRDVLEEINLTTCVRHPVLYYLKLENPIKIPVVYNILSDNRYLEFERIVEVPPLSEVFKVKLS